MTASEHKATRALSPVQLRAIALRIQGLDITEIAREVGHDRTTVSRWFATDLLVTEELDPGLFHRHKDRPERQRMRIDQFADILERAIGVLPS